MRSIDDWWWREMDERRSGTEPGGSTKLGRGSARRTRILLARLTTDDVREARLAACVTARGQLGRAEFELL